MSDGIKSGPQVVSDFLHAMQGNGGIDATVLAAINKLVEEGKLSRTKLLNALQAIREDATKVSAPENGG